MRRAVRFGIRLLRRAFRLSLGRLPMFRLFYETANIPMPITFSHWFWQKVLGYNRYVYWPVHFSSQVVGSNNVLCGVGTNPGYAPGCYIQALGQIFIGDYTQIAANVGIISSNHDLYDSRKHILSSVKIGSYCWLGMNSVVLPGVELGDFVIVGAGAVVTKSFPEGYCVIAGNPARLIKTLDQAQCVRYSMQPEYVGYIPKEKFEAFRQRQLNV